MEHKDHADFIAGIHQRKKMVVRYFSNKDQKYVIRKVAPMDFGPKSGEASGIDRYHVWDYESPSKPHPASLDPSQIQSFTVLEDQFDPAEFVTWKTNWHVKRDWGEYS